MGLSPGVDFETKLFFKPEAAQLLETRAVQARLSSPRSSTSAATPTPTSRSERQLRITRGVLEVLDRFSHPFSIITKSALIARDADLLGSMAERGLAKAFVSVTTLDRKLARVDGAPGGHARAAAAGGRELARAGVPAGVGFAPVIPGLNDHEMEAVLERAARGRRDARPCSPS